jgi:hypothetical protein
MVIIPSRPHFSSKILVQDINLPLNTFKGNIRTIPNFLSVVKDMDNYRNAVNISNRLNGFLVPVTGEKRESENKNDFPFHFL